MYRNLYVILLGVLSSIEITNSKGTLELQFVKYENPGGEGSNGNCCDGMSIFCGSACDHNFDICIDVQSGPRDMKVCPYGSKISGEISNQNTIIFGNKVGVLDNPMKFGFTQSWPGGVKVKVNVHDKDNNNDDHVDYLEKLYTAHPKLYSLAKDDWVQFNIKGRTTLTAKIRVYCDMYYYNANCDTLCKPGNSQSEGFYTCHPTTGSKICKEGWQGKYCKTPVDPCLSSPCESYHICTSSGSNYDCICPTNKTGQFCNETVLPECTNTTCLNGGNCSVTNGTISCECQTGWTGANCESMYDPCDTHLCYNNGTCNSTDDGTAKCNCEEGWSGNNCETEFNPCGDGCMNNGTCVSESGFPNNNVSLFLCACSENYTGVYCETQLTTTSTAASPTTQDTKTPSVVLTFVGVVKDDEKLSKEFQHLIYDLTGEKDGIEILYKKEYPTTVKGKPLTKVSFKVLNGKGENINDELNTVISETRFEDIDKYFTLPLYREEPIKPRRLEHTGWIHSHWYVILIVMLLFIILMVVLGCLVARVKRRKVSERKQKEFLARQSSNISDAVPAQSFENSLYFEMNQPIKKDQQAGATGK